MPASDIHVVLSCAVSLDGFMDDRSPERRVLSSQEDLREVHELRADSDMIVIGAGALRADNPSLATRGADMFARRRAQGRAPHPVKVVVTRSGELPRSCAFFADGDGEKIVLADTNDMAALNARFGDVATLARFEGDWGPALVALAAARGLRSIMIEGGARTIRHALAAGLAQRWRLAVAPVLLGEAGRAPLFDPAAPLAARAMRLERCRLVGATMVAEFAL